MFIGSPSIVVTGSSCHLSPAMTASDAMPGAIISCRCAALLRLCAISIIDMILFMLEVYCQSGIELPSCEIVRYGILLVCDVGNPIVEIGRASCRERV